MGVPEPSRRWWQSQSFNVLIVIAITAALGIGWLAWQASIVRHRRVIRQQIEATGGVFYVGQVQLWIYPEEPIDERLPAVGIRPRDPDYTISKIRLLLGDQSVNRIGFNRQPTAADREAVGTFPEAYIFGRP